MIYFKIRNEFINTLYTSIHISVYFSDHRTTVSQVVTCDVKRLLLVYYLSLVLFFQGLVFFSLLLQKLLKKKI